MNEMKFTVLIMDGKHSEKEIVITKDNVKFSPYVHVLRNFRANVIQDRLGLAKLHVEGDNLIASWTPPGKLPKDFYLYASVGGVIDAANKTFHIKEIGITTEKNQDERIGPINPEATNGKPTT